MEKRNNSPRRIPPSRPQSAPQKTYAKKSHQGKMRRPPHTSSKTSWGPVATWYDALVSDEGSFSHRQVILPPLLKRAGCTKDSHILDLGCGQGMLSRHLPKEARYLGVEISADLLKKAKERRLTPHHRFVEADATTPLPIEETTFSHAFMILSLQNMSAPSGALKNVRKHLHKEGTLFLVLNHPCFRIPRQSSWGIDKDKDLQYRRVDHYLSSMEIPIFTHPSRGPNSPSVPSFHHSLSSYAQWLEQEHFVITHIEEWTSPKKSIGTAAKRENRAREEFPLFLLIEAKPNPF